MKKRFLSALFAACMLSLSLVQASAAAIPTDTSSPTDIPIIDYMDGSITLYGSKVPSTFHNISESGTYKGAFTALKGNLYTNYYFKPNSDGKLHVSGSVAAVGATQNYFKVDCVELTSKKVVSTYTTGEVSFTGISYSKTFSKLDKNKHYYFAIHSGGATEGSGDAASGSLDGSINVSYP